MVTPAGIPADPYLRRRLRRLLWVAGGASFALFLLLAYWSLPAASEPASQPLLASGRPLLPGHDWRYVVVHHSGTKSGGLESFQHGHRARGWNGAGYHFVIANGRGAPDGLIEVSERWMAQEPGAHAGNDHYNRYGIGICLVGDFRGDQPTRKQRHALTRLTAALCQRYGIPAKHIIGHNAIRPGYTECPGSDFPLQELRAEVAQRLAR